MFSIEGGRILDEGKLGWSIGIALIAALLLQGPSYMIQQKRMNEVMVQMQADGATADEADSPDNKTQPQLSRIKEIH